MSKYVKYLFLSFIAFVFFINTSVTAQTSTDQEKWPTKQITFIVSLGQGGSADRTARALAQRLQDEMGVPIRVINQKGGGGHVGNVFFLSQPDDGSVFLATSIHPYIANAITRFDADYSLNDFAFINGQWTDYDIFAINAKLPFKNMDEFMAAVAKNPGKYRVSVVPGSSGAINVLLLLEAYGIDKDALNIVTYEGGGSARSAVAGGQVDMTVLGASGSVSIAEFIQPLAVASNKRVKEWPDTPTMNEILADKDLSMPVLTGSMRGLAAQASFKKKHPDLFNQISAAYQKVLKDSAFISTLTQQGIGSDWLGPDQTTEIIVNNAKILEKYSK